VQRGRSRDLLSTVDWISITDLAEKRGVSKAAISKRVIRYERDGLVMPRIRNGQKLVHEEMFETACRKYTDGIQQLNGTTQTQKRAKERAAVEAEEFEDEPLDPGAVARRAVRKAARDPPRPS